MNLDELLKRVEELCDLRNQKRQTVYLSCGVGKDFGTALRNGSKPSIEKIIKIADYLDCSVDYLLGRTSKPTSESNDLSADEKRVLALFARLDDFDRGIIIGRMEAALESEKYKQDGLSGEKAM